MFDLNTYILIKMGWFEYEIVRGLSFKKKLKSYTIFKDDELVRFFIEFRESNRIFIIKELSDSEKQNSKNIYKFIVVDVEKEDISFKSFEFNSNMEIWKLIQEYEACDPEYKRVFRLNKLLK